MNRPKQPLYRKLNKRAFNFHLCRPSTPFRDERNTKAMKSFEGYHRSIGRTREGYDYTPLFKFLLSKVGQSWNDVFSEAVSRLDKQEPVFWMVDLNFKEGDEPLVRIGENTFYAKLKVVDDILLIADENVVPAKYCDCCTHTFNGKAY